MLPRLTLYARESPSEPITPAPTTIEDHLKVLRDSIEVQVPLTGGIHPVKPEDLVIYYDVAGEQYQRRIDLGNTKDTDLVALASACDQATFGRDRMDVLDETYRKAGKLDLTQFASRLDVVASGLLDAISPDILHGQDFDNERTLRAELYKLNVYGPGSFFKGHKDTPRGETMIGSLVVIFPTAHTGGALTLEHGGTTYTFDSGTELAASTVSPGLAYVAFYSDVTHAVEPVQTGHRVTLTYNLFLVDRTPPTAGSRMVPASELALEDSLRTLLADPSFLADGGFLAYGLAHQYPMPPAPDTTLVDGEWVVPPSRLGPVLQMLKGSDARIRTVSEQAGLVTRVKILYDSGSTSDEAGNDVLVDDVLNMEHFYESYEEGTKAKKEIDSKGVVLARGEERVKDLKAARRYFNNESDEEDEDMEKEPVNSMAVHWVTKISETNRVTSRYIAYGNYPSIQHVYGNAALFVHVPAFGEGIRA